MKEINKEEVLNLLEGTEYVVYNPLTNHYEIEYAGARDIAHYKHVYSGLRYFIIG